MNKTPGALGIIGGSGLYRIPGMEQIRDISVDTPFGPPSSPIVCGTVDGHSVYFLARHGRGHTLTPSEVPYKANVWAMKSLGVTRLLSVSAVGSLKEEIQPGHLVIPDQIIDRTLGRMDNTFFGKGLVAHVAMADPYCLAFRNAVARAAATATPHVHSSGTLVCIEGPQFSTRAESFLYRSWNADLVGMTAMPEARLAREASLCYTTLAMATDYDCWREAEAGVNVADVLEIMKSNQKLAVQTILALVPRMDAMDPCLCAEALDFALVTLARDVPTQTLERLELLLPDSYHVTSDR
jgi:5'-methylthioadenosine phosphorylase